MAEEPMTIFQETSIPYIDANVFPEASFHNFRASFHDSNCFKAYVQLACSSFDGRKGDAHVWVQIRPRPCSRRMREP